MKANILVKRVLGTDSVKQDLSTGFIVHTLKEAVRQPLEEKTLTAVRAEKKSNVQATDDFRYSGRCYCGM